MIWLYCGCDGAYDDYGYGMVVVVCSITGALHGLYAGGALAPSVYDRVWVYCICAMVYVCGAVCTTRILVVL